MTSAFTSAVPRHRGSLVVFLLGLLHLVGGCDSGEPPPDPPDATPLATEVKTITSGSMWSQAQFAPDGQSVFYVVNDASGQGAATLRITNLVGTQVGQADLTGGALPSGRVTSLAVTSNGQNVAYAINYNVEGASQWAVVIARRDGTNAFVVMQSGDGPAGHLTRLDPVAFSRDGSVLALVGFSKDDGVFEMWTYRSDAPPARLLPGVSAKPLFFTPSGDLLYARSDAGGALYAVAPDGSGDRALATGGAILPPSFQPTFSEDDRLLFGRFTFDGSETGQVTLYTVPFGGGTETQVVGGDGFKAPAALTTDGARALYTLEIETAGGISIAPYVVGTGGSETPRLLVDGYTEARGLAFSANGSRVLFVSNPGGVQTLHVATLP